MEAFDDIDLSSLVEESFGSEKKIVDNNYLNCNKCKSENINNQDGYIVCLDCGNCMEGSFIDYGFEARNYGTGSNPRIGPVIDNGETPVVGSVGNGQGSMLLKKVGKWMGPSYESRRKHIIRTVIQDNCNKAEPPISAIIQDTATNVV